MATSKKEKTYSIALKIGDKVYKSSGATPVDALSQLPHPPKFLQKGELKLGFGSVTKTMLLTPVKVKQLYFTSLGLQTVKAKQLFMGLK